MMPLLAITFVLLYLSMFVDEIKSVVINYYIVFTLYPSLNALEEVKWS